MYSTIVAEPGWYMLRCTWTDRGLVTDRLPVIAWLIEAGADEEEFGSATGEPIYVDPTAGIGSRDSFTYMDRVILEGPYHDHYVTPEGDLPTIEELAQYWAQRAEIERAAEAVGLES
jgi:hypothetical protein